MSEASTIHPGGFIIHSRTATSPEANDPNAAIRAMVNCHHVREIVKVAQKLACLVRERLERDRGRSGPDRGGPDHGWSR